MDAIKWDEKNTDEDAHEYLKKIFTTLIEEVNIIKKQSF
jgi:hypothetical protein